MEKDKTNTHRWAKINVSPLERQDARKEICTKEGCGCVKYTLMHPDKKFHGVYVLNGKTSPTAPVCGGGKKVFDLISSTQLLKDLDSYREKLENTKTVKDREFKIMATALFGVRLLIEQLKTKTSSNNIPQ